MKFYFEQMKTISIQGNIYDREKQLGNKETLDVIQLKQEIELKHHSK